MEESLAVVSETLLKLLAGEEDAALDSAERQTHFVGNLIVLVAGHMHGKGHAIFIWELIDCIGDFLSAV